MDKNEVQEKLKSTLQSATGSIKTAAQNVKIPDIKKPDIKIPGQVKGLFKKKDWEEERVVVPSEGDEQLEKDTTETETKETEKSEENTKLEEVEAKTETAAIKAISTRSAMKVFYYLLSVDGEVLQSEEEKFDEIGEQIDPDYSNHKKNILAECKAQLSKVIDQEDYYDVVQDGVEEAILIPDKTTDSFITPKLLVWNLLTLAYSDEKYDDLERKLIKYIVRKFNIDSTVFLEMENSLVTLMDIEKETNWIKTTNKPYLTIEAHVNELAERRGIVFESVKDLIML